MIRALQRILALVGALLPPLQGSTQEYSHDGNRWYEVEIIIFTNAPLGPYQEHAIPGRVEPGYPPRVRGLTLPGASYSAQFEAPPAAPTLARLDVGGDFPVAAPGFPDAAPALADEELAAPPPDLGPSPLERAAEPFRLLDPARDPFIALPQNQRRLGEALRRLDAAAGHRVLYHAAWRQPGQPRAQAQAVFVRGGDRFGNHDELEGSVLLSDFGNGVNVDLHLWLSTFRAAGLFDRGEAAWALPPQPASVVAASAASTAVSGTASASAADRPGFPRGTAFTPPPRYVIDRLAYLRQDRNVAMDTLHYFDNPAVGAIVQVRPYVLPLPPLIGAE